MMLAGLLLSGAFAQNVPIPFSEQGAQARTRDELDAFGEIIDAPDALTRIHFANRFRNSYPDSEFLQFALASAMHGHQDLGEPDKALAVAEQILAINPRNFDAMLTAAVVLADASTGARDNRTARAQDYARRALEQISRLAIPAAGGVVDWRRGKREFLARARAVLGWIHFQQGELAQAAENLEHAVALDGARGEYVYRLAVVQAERGDIKQARTLLDRARLLGPEPISALAARHAQELSHKPRNQK